MGMGSGSKLAGATLAAACVLTPMAAQAANAAAIFYERTLMSVAGARCGLFDAEVAAALAAGAAQARGAALRSGVPAAEVKATGERARAKAAATPCGSPDLQLAASRVRAAFEGWARITRMTYPGESAAWVADRTAYRSVRWRLSQAGKAAGTPATFGVAGDLDRTALLAVAAFGPEQPYAARLVMRDEARAGLPWLTGAASGRPLPPRASSLVVMAEHRAAAEKSLLTGEARSGVAFRFPARAADRLAELDPRERFAVEFLFPGDKVKTAVFEVGDFAAGRAFLSVKGPAASGRRSAG